MPDTERDGRRETGDGKRSESVNIFVFTLASNVVLNFVQKTIVLFFLTFY